ELVAGARGHAQHPEDGVAKGHLRQCNDELDMSDSTCTFRHMNAAASDLSPTRRRWLLAAVMSGLLLAMLDQSIVGTALPKIVETLGGNDLYVWVATAYLVTATVTLPIYARLSDRHG